MAADREKLEAMGQIPEFNFHVVNAAELLGQTALESDKVGLAEADILLRVQCDEAESARFSAYFDIEPMRRRRFLGFLNDVAPGREGSMIGTIADWEETRRPGGTLYRRHTNAFGDDWVDFVDQADMFIRVMQEEEETPRFYDHVENQALERNVTLGVPQLRAKWQNQYSRLPLAQLEGLFAGEPTLPDFRDFVVSFVRKNMGKRRNMPGKPENAYDLFTQWGTGRRSRGIAEYFETLDEDERERIFERYVEAFPGYTKDDGERFYVDGTHVNSENLQRAYEERQLITSRGGAFAAELMVVGRRKIIVPATIEKLSHAYPKVVPYLEWTSTRPGEIESDRGFDARRTQLTDTTGDDVDVLGSNLVGLLAVALLDTDLRADPDIWPQEKGYTDVENARRQQIQAAQVPLLALIRRNEILSGAVIRKLEGVTK